MPTTPRSNAYASTSATPRSSRRLTTSATTVGTPSRVTVLAAPELPSLPLLNTKKYPTTPYAEDVEFHDMLQQDLDSVDNAIEMLSLATEDVRKQLREHLTHLESERIAYEHKIRELGDVAKDMVRTQQREREELDKAKQHEGEVNRQQQKLRVRLEGYQQEVREAMHKLEHRRQLKSRQREAFAQQLAQNKPELDFFEQKLGLKIRGKGHDVVQFKFVNLDRTSYSRSFSFDLDVSTCSYTVSAISPTNYLSRELVNKLTTDLNEQSIDLYTFVREMRFEFGVQVELEKRLGPPRSTTVDEPDSDRDRERDKIRKECQA
ncbi:uncharacterized protein JCM15063_004861 [Sporobolomyces koalae]|uniref:uncharacterized protein n=1 Tax=Sporobolomyces koalae TaxID=500713 RepID=UPI003174D903